jgi:hypothetical protein
MLKTELSYTSSPPSGPSWLVIWRTLPLPYQVLCAEESLVLDIKPEAEHRFDLVQVFVLQIE